MHWGKIAGLYVGNFPISSIKCRTPSSTLFSRISMSCSEALSICIPTTTTTGLLKCRARVSASGLATSSSLCPNKGTTVTLALILPGSLRLGRGCPRATAPTWGFSPPRTSTITPSAVTTKVISTLCLPCPKTRENRRIKSTYLTLLIYGRVYNRTNYH